MPEPLEAAYRFAVALAIGILIGIERERKRFRPGEEPGSIPAGVRTFALIALLGCSSGWLGDRYGAAVFAVALASFAAVVVAIYVMTSIAGDLGATTEVAALLTFLLGAMAWSGDLVLAGAIAVGMAVILALRDPLHAFAERIRAEDLEAALTLAVVTVIVLPLLPDEGYGPFAVWNPRKIWLLVVFISGLGFAGYIGIKLLGPGRGIALQGLLGGIVSSTAATLSLAGRSRELPALGGAFTVAIALAWATMFVRVLVEVAAVDLALVPDIAPAIGAATAAGALCAGLLYLRHRREAGPSEGEAATYRNPFSLWSAMKLGLLFAAALLVARAAREWFQDAGLLVAAGLAGLVDVDVIALSTARLTKEGVLAEPTAARAIYIAAAANTVAKAAMAASLGSPSLRRTLIPTALVTIAAGAAAAVAVG